MTGHPTTTALNRHNYIFHIILLFFGYEIEYLLSKLHKKQSEHSRLIIGAYHYCARTHDYHFYYIYHFERTMGPCIEHFFCDLAATEIVPAELMFSLKLWLYFCCS